jgi:hypothetical protein
LFDKLRTHHSQTKDQQPYPTWQIQKPAHKTPVVKSFAAYGFGLNGTYFIVDTTVAALVDTPQNMGQWKTPTFQFNFDNRRHIDIFKYDELISPVGKGEQHPIDINRFPQTTDHEGGEGQFIAGLFGVLTDELAGFTDVYLDESMNRWPSLSQHKEIRHDTACDGQRFTLKNRGYSRHVFYSITQPTAVDSA